MLHQLGSLIIVLHPQIFSKKEKDWLFKPCFVFSLMTMLQTPVIAPSFVVAATLQLKYKLYAVIELFGVQDPTARVFASAALPPLFSFFLMFNNS